MVTLAIYSLNFFHPGIWLNKENPTGHDLEHAADEEEEEEAEEEAAA